MTKEEIIQGGLDIYNNCRILIKSLCLSVKDVLKDENFYEGLNDDGKAVIAHYRDNFSEEKELMIFDYVLQALLLCEALADGDFCEAEKEFIEALTKENDIMTTIEDTDWNDAYNADSDRQKDLLEMMNAYLNDMTDEFVDPLALLDAFTTQDVLLDLSDHLAIISSLIGQIDGEYTEEEKEAFNQYANELILGKWADLKGLVQISE